MKYRTLNELNHFNFADANISELKQMNGYFYAILDNVTILPENSCNRDIRQMRTNHLIFQIPNGQIIKFVEEGYKVYDANGNLSRQYDDTVIPVENYNEELQKLTDCVIYSIQKTDSIYILSIDTEDHTYLIHISGTEDTEEWDRFMSKDEC